MCAVNKIVKIINNEPATCKTRDMSIGQYGEIVSVDNTGGAHCNVGKIVQKQTDGSVRIVSLESGIYLDSLTGGYLVRPLKVVKLELAYA